jgi:hypothetical protein
MTLFIIIKLGRCPKIYPKFHLRREFLTNTNKTGCSVRGLHGLADVRPNASAGNMWKIHVAYQ